MPTTRYVRFAVHPDHWWNLANHPWYLSCSSLTPIRTLDPSWCTLRVVNAYTRHVKRVLGYARPSDYAFAGGMAAASPLSFWLMERVSPSHVGKGGFAPVMRLATAIGLVGGLHILYQRSCSMSIPEYTPTAHHLSVRLTIPQTASMALRRIRERLNWTLGRWSAKSRTVNLYTVPLKSLIIYKG